MSRPDEARTLLRALYATEGDLIPDHVLNTLTVRLHHSANACNDAVIRALCEKPNDTETLFPRTNLKLIFALGSNQIRDIRVSDVGCVERCLKSEFKAVLAE